MEPDRAEIAGRHGVADAVDALRGETREELEASAAAIAALRMQEQDHAAPLVAALEAKNQKHLRRFRSIFGEGGEG